MLQVLEFNLSLGSPGRNGPKAEVHVLQLLWGDAACIWAAPHNLKLGLDRW